MLCDKILVLLSVFRHPFIRLQDVNVIVQIKDNILDHLEIVVVLLEAVKILFLFVEISQDSPSDVDFFVDGGVFKKLDAKVGSPQSNPALRT